MAGPIIAGDHPFMDGLSILVLIILGCVLMSPELSAMVVGKVPWLAPVFGWLHQHLDHDPH
jgi:hypothetical protein